jgi:hypothetical protein
VGQHVCPTPPGHSRGTGPDKAPDLPDLTALLEQGSCSPTCRAVEHLMRRLQSRRDRERRVAPDGRAAGAGELCCGMEMCARPTRDDRPRRRRAWSRASASACRRRRRR